SGATYQDLADGVGLPLYSALMLLDDALKKYGVRDEVKLIASGKITTPDKAAIALALGADLVQVARGFMISVGCIMRNVAIQILVQQVLQRRIQNCRKGSSSKRKNIV